MKKILLLAALALVSCHKPQPKAESKSPAAQAPKVEVDPYPNLPRTGRLTEGEQRKAPKQARDFCARHPEFEQC